MEQASDITRSLRQLAAYVESWNDGTGRYHSPIIHRGNLKRVRNIHDTPWCQAPIIEGYLRLAQRTHHRNWIDRLLPAIDSQCGNIMSDGSFSNAGHEDDRYSSLVHNALASAALARFALYSPPMDEDDSHWRALREKASECARQNTNYLIEELWLPGKKAFRFDKMDFYSGLTDHCVLNMNSIAAEALSLVQKLPGPHGHCYENYVLDIVDFIWSQCSRVGFEYVPYSDYVCGTEIVLYTALTGLGMLSVVQSGACDPIHLGRAVQILELCRRRVLENRLDELRNYAHGQYNGTRVKYPVFIAGSSVIFEFLHKWAKVNDLPTEGEAVLTDVKYLLSRWQRPSGGVSDFLGYNTRDNFRPRDGGQTWEDTLPTPGWNGFLFRLLVNMTADEQLLTLSSIPEFSMIRDSALGMNYFWRESKTHLLVLGWNPLRSLAIYRFQKSQSRAKLWWDMRRVKSLVKRSYFCN